MQAHAVPTVTTEGAQYVVSGATYRARFVPETAGFDLELKGTDGQWHLVGAKAGAADFALFANGQEFGVRGARATWAAQADGGVVRVAQQVVIDPMQGTVMELNFICTDEGVLMGARVIPAPQDGTVWCPPRIALPPDVWDGYLFWDQTGRRHEGRMSELGQEPTYAGVSAWGPAGDTVPALDSDHPALISRSGSFGVGLGAVYVDLASQWGDARMFIQRHTPASLYLYAGYAPTSDAIRWAWLAPISAGEEERQVERLVQAGRALAAGFTSIAKAVPEEWKQPVPDFPANLRRADPVRDINEAAVYSINEDTNTDYGLSLARKAGSDVLIRGWFKWAQAPPVDQWRDIPPKVHEQGALFGGGITCSALYDGENGSAEAQWKDLATRGPAGQLIDAWDTPGIRHGTLSSPAYLDYLFRWCKAQIDAGADYLFMDEIGAALSQMEGFDDYSLADFRRYLLENAPQTQGFAPDDARWADLGIDLANNEVCPDGTMRSFDYRAFMKAKGVLEKPTSDANPLSALWWQFRSFRDDRAWKALTDRLRAYAAEQGRTLHISANGLAKYVDLQVLGVWGDFSAKGGHIDLSENQIPVWRSTVLRGREVAGKRVPVVFFHDWGFGDPPFPFLALPPSEREIWDRVRGAEIYAAGAFYAFPVLGPFGCDAGRDGTLREIARQTTFYQANRDLYLKAEHVGSELLRTEAPNLSLAASWSAGDNTLLLHVINRDLRDGALAPRESVAVEVPVSGTPKTTVAVSPDWQGERDVRFEKRGAALRITLPRLEAYAVVKVAYAGPVDLADVRDPARIVPPRMWARPMRNEFVVRPDCHVENSADLNGFLQGRLHTQLRNPPTFLVNATTPARLLVMVQAVATAGARIEYGVDGVLKQSVDLPDLDGKNDGQAGEYDRLLTLDVPAGRHQLTLDNTGGDWCTISWLQFEGEFGEW
jgi:hypothetical protein